MQRWTPRTRFWAYQFLVARDGERCIICGKSPNGNGLKQLEIDHADSNPRNNDPSNLHLVCPSCNKQLQKLSIKQHQRLIHKGYMQYGVVSEHTDGNKHIITSKNLTDYEDLPIEIKLGIKYESHYKPWLLDKVNKLGSYPYDEAIYSGAEVVKCSPITAKRYLRKMISEAGALKVINNSANEPVLVYKDADTKPELAIAELIKQAARASKRINAKIKECNNGDGTKADKNG